MNSLRRYEEDTRHERFAYVWLKVVEGDWSDWVIYMAGRESTMTMFSITNAMRVHYSRSQPFYVEWLEHDPTLTVEQQRTSNTPC